MQLRKGDFFGFRWAFSMTMDKCTMSNFPFEPCTKNEPFNWQLRFGRDPSPYYYTPSVYLTFDFERNTHDAREKKNNEQACMSGGAHPTGCPCPTLSCNSRKKENDVDWKDTYSNLGSYPRRAYLCPLCFCHAPFAVLAYLHTMRVCVLLLLWTGTFLLHKCHCIFRMLHSRSPISFFFFSLIPLGDLRSGKKWKRKSVLGPNHTAEIGASMKLHMGAKTNARTSCMPNPSVVLISRPLKEKERKKERKKERERDRERNKKREINQM